ncbi:MAG: IS4 family transposase, partial [Cyanobacteria bacterium P01_C01_bin.70]
NHYAGRLQEHQDKTLRQSDFGLGLDGQRWIYSLALWPHWAGQLMALKSHKQRCFRRGLQALSPMQKAF